jgi:alpha-amylase/alpha-mannosidase (GH57 family)
LCGGRLVVGLIASKFVCIHGHFYQPPRENPWLEAIEWQDSAYPYHDWNERILAECYEPNTASRILGPDGRIHDIMNNYSKISFDFGPTLLLWLQGFSPEVYGAVVEADGASKAHFDGHGSGIAQCYNHMIMPLANGRDKRTQVVWGIADFRHRFGRDPVGMWLPETAVDVETLDLLAEYGIRFTILAPSQAKRVRETGNGDWKDVNESSLDMRHPYLCRLPSGRTIVLFFYNGPLAKDVAFHGILNNGEKMARRFLDGFSKNAVPELMSIATDGETYGHHYHFAEMTLSYCLFFLESRRLAIITNYADYLDMYPPTAEVEIREDTSWSCVHGIERWRSNCGCTAGSHPEWNQMWRSPLRAAMDWLRDSVIPLYESKASPLVKDPWKARDDYISVILDRSTGNVEKFFRDHAQQELTHDEKISVLKLLEMQRHAMYMFTSCGWFFEEVTRLESRQIMVYACRVIQLAKALTDVDLEPQFIEMLKKAPSNLKEFENAGAFYEREVAPLKLDLLCVGAHYAISSIFRTYQPTQSLYCYTVSRKHYHRLRSGLSTLVVGTAHITNQITWEEGHAAFAALQIGENTIFGGVRTADDASDKLLTTLAEAFKKGDIPGTIRHIDRSFELHTSLQNLFRDEQRKILNQIIGSSLTHIESTVQSVYEQYSPLMNMLRDIKLPLPYHLAITVEFITNNSLQKTLESDEPSIHDLTHHIEEYKQWNTPLDRTTLGFLASRRICQMMTMVSGDPEKLEPLEKIVLLIETLHDLNLSLNLWKAQNLYFHLGKKNRDHIKKSADQGDMNAKRWIELFDKLGGYMGVTIT